MGRRHFVETCKSWHKSCREKVEQETNALRARAPWLRRSGRNACGRFPRKPKRQHFPCVPLDAASMKWLSDNVTLSAKCFFIHDYNTTDVVEAAPTQHGKANFKKKKKKKWKFNIVLIGGILWTNSMFASVAVQASTTGAVLLLILNAVVPWPFLVKHFARMKICGTALIRGISKCVKIFSSAVLYTMSEGADVHS